MGIATLTIDLNAVAANWHALSALSRQAVQTGAVIKSDGYGMGAGRVSAALAKAGTTQFFIAMAEEGVTVRTTVGPAPEVFVFSGHMAGDTDLLRRYDLTPLLNSASQFARHQNTLSGYAFGVQLDTGMNRLGMAPAEFNTLRQTIMDAGPRLIISHLACADVPDHPQNGAQLAAFSQLTDGLNVPRSLAATAGILLGPAYHFDLVRPGIGLYGGQPFYDAAPVVRISIPVIQTRDIAAGQALGYSATWTSKRPSKIATISAGYADGLIRAMGEKAMLYAGNIACPHVGRVSMDLMTVDVTDLATVPDYLDILGAHQNIDTLAAMSGTIGHEILTSLGARYKRVYIDN